ncbi:hypothetical protein [Amycolatopsis echigonensis]|uniref:Uncharacterized protein n=1 Tax=Amycolatopsis echigonensis TaxID=2576905 RepID=A0A8E1W798_9PSEU|nr:hypothetical protein [Amycolatopsis echigonensis]MBB2505131.1 hypothetical protein [Amycolatopsis echigonensis]
MATERKPTQKEAQLAAAALEAYSKGNVEQARRLNKILEIFQEDTDNDAEEE